MGVLPEYQQKGISVLLFKKLNEALAYRKVYVEANYVLDDNHLMNNALKQLKFDLVILATTMIPKEDATELAKILGVEINEFNFYKAKSFQPQKSSKEGIFLCTY